MPEVRKRVLYCSILLILVAVVRFTLGLTYFLKAEPMPYHIEYIGMSLEEVGQFNPKLADFMCKSMRASGIGLMALGVFLFAVAAVPFRRAERWAWIAVFVAVFLPLLGILQTSLSIGGGIRWIMLGQLALFLTAMLVPIKDFFGSRVEGR